MRVCRCPPLLVDGTIFAFVMDVKEAARRRFHGRGTAANILLDIDAEEEDEDVEEDEFEEEEEEEDVEDVEEVLFLVFLVDFRRLRFFFVS